jgi:16S rRNA C1402 (ribose-2'-O) methylase RsmI
MKMSKSVSKIIAKGEELIDLIMSGEGCCQHEAWHRVLCWSADVLSSADLEQTIFTLKELTKIYEGKLNGTRKKKKRPAINKNNKNKQKGTKKNRRVKS